MEDGHIGTSKSGEGKSLVELVVVFFLLMYVEQSPCS